MVAEFSLERVNKAPASFDPQKLMAFQNRYFQRLPDKQKVKMTVPFLQAAGLVDAPPACETGPYVSALIQAAGDRMKVAGDILDYDDFFVADVELCYDDKALGKRLRKPPEAATLLRDFRAELSAAENLEPAALERLLKEWVESKGIKIGQIIHALRVCGYRKGRRFRYV